MKNQKKYLLSIGADIGTGDTTSLMDYSEEEEVRIIEEEINKIVNVR
ncbi:hypothetical protein [Paenibacillus etheri]|nr:hypothetical protein [Paenibacillus etheri]